MYNYLKQVMKRFVVAIIFLTIVFRVAAQDYIFSQYYLDKFSINPAFAGIGAYSEVGTIFRDQWPGIEKGYKIYSAYYRQKLPSVQSGLALRVNGNVSGGAYSQNSASAIYAYDFHLTYGVKCSLGIEIGFLNKSLNQSQLVYYSMIDAATGNTSALNESVEYDSYNSLHFSTGVCVYTKHTIVGLGVHRLTKMVITGVDNYMPVLLTGFVNHKIVLNTVTIKQKVEDIYILPSLLYTHSPVADMIMPGVSFSGYKLRLGLAYRYQRSDYQSSAIVTSIGFSFGNLELGFGHDFDLGAISGISKGSNEVGLKYNFENSQKNKGSKTILCPAF